MPQADYNTFEKPQLVEFLLEKDHLLEQTQHLVSTIDRIITNKNQSYSDRVQTASIVLGHPQEVLSGQPFVLNVDDERKRSGLSNKSAATYFQAMKESGGIEYDVSQKQKTAPDGSKIHTSESTIRFTDTFDVVNTKGTGVKEKIKEDDKERREARMQKLKTPICPSCHSDQHIHFAPVPFCSKCEVQMDATEHFPAVQLCLLVEEPENETPPVTPLPTACKECGLSQEEASHTVAFLNGVCSVCVEIATSKGAVA